MYDDILLKVKRPGQYIGCEWNVSVRDFERAEVKFALSFPDLYEIGMSNLGVRIIYGLLNSLPDIACERFFAVDKDLEGVLRGQGREILSLESRRKLGEFDLAGFSLGSELNYTNVLNILDLAHLPLKSAQRDCGHPLIIGGGPCALNPEPMHDFFDLFIIGEAEEALPELIRAYRQYKQPYKSGKMDKGELLLALSRIEGVYVPSFYEVAYDRAGQIKKFAPDREGVFAKIKKRFIADLDASYYPKEWLVPQVQVVHDRVTLEVMRGCPNRCRFCQARAQYFPLRLRGVNNVLSLAEGTYKCTGYEEFSLSGLSVSDYPRLSELLKGLTGLFSPKGVGLSLPSVKAHPVMGSASSLIAKFKKTGLTFAPEAGSERLRDILAKDFNSADFFQALKEAYASGYQHVKLYFMIGIPGEREEDLDALIDFSARVSLLKKELGSAAAGVSVSINSLIPKPHTALQWFPMQDLAGARCKQDYLKDKSRRNKRLKLSFHDLQMSRLEGILARGDRRLSGVILSAFKRGARFDAWGGYFDSGIWEAAFKDSGVDPEFYLKGRSTAEFLPWDFIDTGMDKDALASEFDKISEDISYGAL